MLNFRHTKKGKLKNDESLIFGIVRSWGIMIIEEDGDVDVYDAVAG